MFRDPQLQPLKYSMRRMAYPMLPVVGGEQCERKQRQFGHPHKSFLKWPINQVQQQIEYSKSVISYRQKWNNS